MSNNLISNQSVLAFDGQDDYLLIPNKDAINFAQNQNFCIELWLKVGTIEPAANTIFDVNIIEKWQGSAFPYAIRYSSTRGTISCSRYDGKSTSVSSKILVNDQKFHHIAFVKQDSKLFLYVDGIEQSQTQDTITQSTKNGSALYVAAGTAISKGGGGRRFFAGQIAELRLWNIARTPEEIQQNMNSRLTGNEPGLVAYYPLNGDADDKTSNANHGTINGSVWQQEELPIQAVISSEMNTNNSVLFFDGVDDCINLGKKSAFKVEKNLTIEAWIYADQQKEWAGILSNIFDNGLIESGYGLLLDGKSGIYLGLEPSNQTLQNMPYLSSGANTLNLRKWHHVAGTYNGEQMKVYIDGVEKATLAVAPSPIKYNSENDLLIGMYKDDNEFYAFKGKIAEVRLWNRTRSAEEIKADMNRYLSGNEAGLVGYWQLNEGSGNTVIDKTSNANNGTVNGAIWQQEELPIQVKTNNSEISKSLPSVLMFDGKDDYLEIPYNQSLNPSTFTVSAWVKVVGSQGAWRSVITCRDNFKGYIIYAGNNNQWQAWVGNGSAWEVINNNNTPVVLNAWTHVASTFDGKQLKLYVNGTEVGSKNVAYTLNTRCPLRIGAGFTEAKPQYFYPGQIAEVSVWNKALTGAEIQAKMNQRLTGNEESLVAYWPLNEGSGSITTDKTGKGNNGTINGAIWQQEELPIQAAISVDINSIGTVPSVLTFDGIDDYVKLPDGILTASYTKEAWIKLAEPANPYNNILSGNQHALFVPNAIAAGHNGQWHTVQTPQPCPKNTWLHVAVTYNSQTQTMCLYQNGQLTSQATNVPPFDASDRTLDIGIHRNGYLFKGEIAEARIWDFARTQEMIQKTMSSRLTGQETGLAAYYPLNEGAGNVATDKTGKGKNGTINGATWKQEELPIQAAISGEIEVATQPTVSDFVKVGPKGGSIPATDFELLPDKTVAKSRLKSVWLNEAWAISRLQLEYENIASTAKETYLTEIVGSGGGNRVEISIQPGDYLTKISGNWGRQAPGYVKEEIIAIQLETKNGKKSPIFGGGSGKSETEPFVLEAPEGQEIIGFFGSHGGPQDLLVRLGIYCRPISIENQQPSEAVQPPQIIAICEPQPSIEIGAIQSPELIFVPENQQPSEAVQPPASSVATEEQKPVEPRLKVRKGFSYGEAILMTNLSKYAYDTLKYDDSSVDDVERRTVDTALYRDQGWQLVHTIRNEETKIRGLILKNTQLGVAHQYTIAFRGSIFTDFGSVDVAEIAADVDWSLMDYGGLAVPRAKVVCGFYQAFESVADEVQSFFKAVRGELKRSDFRRIYQLPSTRKFACITALTDAGGILLGANFSEQAQALVTKVVAEGKADKDEELEKILQFVEEQLLPNQSPLKEPVEVWVTGHGLGGSYAQLAALALRRWFGGVGTGGLLIKVYAIAAPKIGNQQFVDFYNQQIGAELSYRVENVLDAVPNFPLDPPFPISAIAPGGLQLGNIFIGNYANGGEPVTVVGISGQSASISFGSVVNIPFSVPFPHSPEAYIELLEQQRLFWEQLIYPAKDILRPFFVDLLRDQQKR